MLRATSGRAALLLAAVAFAAASAAAQSGRGVLRGYVSDSASAPNGLAGARVELRELPAAGGPEGGAKTHVLFTDRTGNYTTGAVRMGEYALRIEAEGFEPYETRLLISSDMEAVLGTLLKRSAAATARPVEEVNVEGNRRVGDEWILSRLKTRPGEPYSLVRVREDLDALVELDVFDPRKTTVKTGEGARGGVAVTFSVVELPLVDALKFRGLPGGIGERDAREYLRERKVRLAEGDTYTPEKLRWAENYLNEYLLKRGFWRVTAEGSAREVAPGRYSVEFVVAANGND
jgi:hypothetical protein